MNYTESGAPGQDSIVVGGDSSAREGAGFTARKNECFATFPSPENQTEALAPQGVRHVSSPPGVVTYQSPSRPSSNPPAYICLGKEWLSKRPKPRGRHARKPKKITKAAARHSKDEKKTIIAARAFQREAIAFSLNFSPRKIAQLKASSDPVRIIYNEINRSAKTILGYALPISFEFDLDDNDRLHCHGIAVLPDWEKETIAKFRHVLKRAGGVMHGRGSGRQVDVDRLKDWKGWTGYQHKNADRVIALLGTEKIDYASRELKRLAFSDHDAELNRQKESRRRKKDNPTVKTATATPQRRRKLSANVRHSPARHRSVRRSPTQTWRQPSRRVCRSLQFHRRSATGPP
ncbi:hypothetical protein REJC140_02392 [Pseudorhizobium endolithicum]|uniref:Replication protein n=1 Tax=Pseudorhizobium endolithicum TaxID=1191678 RepID=A0ABM8PFB2_9HYPH|nr:hypothetical protein [Pseudorhizobium endolithicum]CAD7026524.1 hypothetical protein REJC140_02392 [Pseudorhizobium endolithicum]